MDKTKEIEQEKKMSAAEIAKQKQAARIAQAIVDNLRRTVELTFNNLELSQKTKEKLAKHVHDTADKIWSESKVLRARTKNV